MDRDVQSAVVVVLFGVGGILTAGFEKALYDKGVLIDEFITGTISLPDLMTITIILWLLVGVIVAVMKH